MRRAEDRSALSPACTLSKAVVESRMPPAHDSMPAFTSVKYPDRSPARSAVDGLCDSDTTTTPPMSTMMAANTHSGVRRVAQPVCRSGTNGGSVFVGESTGWPRSSTAVSGACLHKAQALVQVGLRHRAEHVVHNAVLRVEEERLREPGDPVRVGRGELRVDADRVADALGLGEPQRARVGVVLVEPDDDHVTMLAGVPAREQRGF